MLQWGGRMQTTKVERRRTNGDDEGRRAAGDAHEGADRRAREDRMTQTELPQRASRTRIETDSMGPMEVPADAYYGASTQRAVLNFPISDLRFPRTFIRALGLIKMAAAEVNQELGLLDEPR